jgi:hypothetical protein
MIVLIVLMANFGLVFAIRGPKSKTASLNYANIGTTAIPSDSPGKLLLFGFFDKMKKSTQGAADCLDILLLDLTTTPPSYSTVGLATDSETYEEFYAEIWGGAFPPAALVDEDVLEICKKGSDIYVEVTETILIPLDGGGTYELPPLSIKIESEGIPYRAEMPPGAPTPSGWTFSRITQRGYSATVTFDCSTWWVEPQTFEGTAEFNSLDTFTPPSQ